MAKKYDSIITLVDRILSAKKFNPQADTTALEREIPSTSFYKTNV